jgi:hypothetical protein
VGALWSLGVGSHPLHKVVGVYILGVGSPQWRERLRTHLLKVGSRVVGFYLCTFLVGVVGNKDQGVGGRWCLPYKVEGNEEEDSHLLHKVVVEDRLSRLSVLQQ